MSILFWQLLDDIFDQYNGYYKLINDIILKSTKGNRNVKFSLNNYKYINSHCKQSAHVLEMQSRLHVGLMSALGRCSTLGRCCPLRGPSPRGLPTTMPAYLLSGGDPGAGEARLLGQRPFLREPPTSGWEFGRFSVTVVCAPSGTLASIVSRGVEWCGERGQYRGGGEARRRKIGLKPIFVESL